MRAKRYDVKEAPMTITLELPPEAEANLVAQAKARGLSLDAFVRTIITTQAAAMERAIDELFDTVQIPSGVGQGAMRRENWYR